jgi:hypothetical protein
VEGNSIKIPDNMQVQLPGTFASFKDFVNGPRPANLEVSVLTFSFWFSLQLTIVSQVTGNIVNGVLIAGQLQASGLLVQSSTGFIKSFGTDGSIVIDDGPTIRINTPNGVYANAFTSMPLFTSDEGNPSISSFGGFPMCVPSAANTATCDTTKRKPQTANM